MMPSGIKAFTRTVSLHVQHQVFHARIATGIAVRIASGFPACIASRFPDSIASGFPAPSTTVSYHGSFLQIKSFFPAVPVNSAYTMYFHKNHIGPPSRCQSATRQAKKSIGNKAGQEEYQKQGRPKRVSKTRQGKSTDSVVKKQKRSPRHTNNGAALSVLL